jgi:polar amino acid transport system ATP-binding protein
MLGIIGSSGSGKSTLARCLTALERIDGGKVGLEDLRLTPETETEGCDATTWRRRVGYVFQHAPLWPSRTGLQQILEGLVYVRGMRKKDAIDLAEAWAIRFDVTEQLGQYPQTLSGGQKQRISLIRALALEPSFLILDEITTGLDPILTGKLSEQMLEVRRATRLGVLFITHQIEFLREHADRVAFLHEGKLIEVGCACHILESPATPELRTFLSSVKRGW